jgi:leukotriene-A4 hydrolase
MSHLKGNSFSELHRVVTEHLHLRWSVSFESRTLTGSATLRMRVLDSSLRTVVLDSRDLRVTAASVNGHATSFALGDTHAAIGTPLSVALPATVQPSAGDVLTLELAYSTSPDAAALQWLTPEQTAGKKLAYLFSQAQAIHSRTMFPNQDTPACKITYSAEVTVEKPYVALMSALRDGDAIDNGATRTFKFKQPRGMPSYLCAIAVGDLVSRAVGPRSDIWAEPSQVDAAAAEFAETEQFIAAGEKLFGPYQWQRYDMLMLPPSFPYGGMENTNLTFLTPTLIAGDRSLADVVAHEAAHSWFGNDVSTKGWEHFWLNEGFTVFAERAIMGEVHSAARRDFSAALGRKALRGSIELFGATHEYTKLVQQLDGIDPDDAFSSVPYEKGFSLLNFLAHVVGRDNFIAFLKAYVAKFTGKSLETDEFKAFFLEHFAAQRAAIDAAVDWNQWLHQPGPPPVLAPLDTSLSDAVSDLSARWLSFDQGTGAEPAADAGAAFFAGQTELLLDHLSEHTPLKAATLAKLDAAFQLSKSGNAEIKFRWFQISCPHTIDAAITFVTSVGRMKYVRPLYRTLNKHNHELALATFERAKQQYHPICAKMVAKDFGI